MGIVSAMPHGVCRACEELAPLGAMRTVDHRPVDLETTLRGRWLCADAEACLARVRARGNGDVLHAVVLPSEGWGAGDVVLVTGDPRRAEEHAAAHHGATVRWRIHTDYRES